MATITVPSVALPNPGDDMDAEQVRDWITNIRTFLEGTSIDEANVDLTGTDGIVGKSTAQTLTGLKSLENTAAAAGGVREVLQLGIDPASGTATDADGGRVVMYADDDGGAETDIARLDWVFVDTANASEDSRVDLYAMTTGAIGAVLELGYDASGNTVNVLQTTEVAAAAVRDVLILEWDPNDGTNLTASSSGIGLAFRMPDSGDSQDIMARIRAVGTDFTATSEDARLDFMVITAGTLAAEVQLDGANFAPTTNDGNALGTTTLGWADLFLATGGVINWANGEATITETDANTLTVAGADLFIANNLGVVIGHTAQITAGEIDELQIIGTASVDARVLLGLWSAGSAGPALDFLKSKNGTIGSFTVVAADDILGTIFWYGDDGFDYSTPGASISGQVDGTPGSNDMPGRLVFSTTADGAASVTERMRITSAGNVLIGTGALATTATNGFLYIPSCAGAPTGVPTSQTGRSPIIHDTTNNRIYLYDMVSAVWAYAALT